MPSPKIGSESKYPDDFRKKVAEDYLLTDMSCKELQKICDLPTKIIIVRFIRRYKNKYNLSAIEVDSSEESLVKPKNLKEKEMLELLQQAKLKIVALETMIDIAEDELRLEKSLDPNRPINEAQLC